MHVRNIFAKNIVVLSLIESIFTNKTIKIALNNKILEIIFFTFWEKEWFSKVERAIDIEGEVT